MPLFDITLSWAMCCIDSINNFFVFAWWVNIYIIQTALLQYTNVTKEMAV